MKNFDLLIILCISVLLFGQNVISQNVDLTNVQYISSTSTSTSNFRLNKCCPSGEVQLGGVCVRIKENNFNDSSYLNVPKHLISPIILDHNAGISFLKFDLDINLPLCSNETFEVILSLKPGDSEQFEDLGIDDRNFFTTNGYFKYEFDYYSPSEYCIDGINESSLILRICSPECTNPLRPCVRRCCNFDQVWDVSGERIKCTWSGPEFSWEPTFFKDPYEQANTTNIVPHYKIEHPKYWCDPAIHNFLIITNKPSNKYHHKPFRILESGQLIEKVSRRRWENVPEMNYCVDGGQNFPEENSTGYYSGDSFRDSIYFYCTEHEEIVENEESWVPILYSVTQIISCIFLLMTAIVYILLWDKQNIHGYTLLGHIICLFMFYLLLAMIHIYSESAYKGIGNEHSGNFCQFLAIGSHYFWLCAFTWMTLLNFDLWWTFSRSLMPTGSKSKGKARFTVYFIFAMIGPTIIVVTGLVLENIYGSDPESEVIVPSYGLTKCFMDTEYAVLPYIYGPIAVMLATNLLFFASTVWGMHKIQKSTRFAVTSSSKNKKQKQRRLLFAKLFLIMGVTWIFELIGWAIHGQKLTWYQIILDFANILQAIAIFVIFVCKSEIFGSLKSKYPSLETFLDLFLIKPERAEQLNKRFPLLKCFIDAFTKEKRRSSNVTDAYNSNKTTFRHGRRSTMSETITEQIEMS